MLPQGNILIKMASKRNRQLEAQKRDERFFKPNKIHYNENNIIKTGLRNLSLSGINKIERNSKGKQWSVIFDKKGNKTSYINWKQDGTSVSLRNMLFYLDKDLIQTY